MKIVDTGLCPYCKQESWIKISDENAARFQSDVQNWHKGALVQEAFPYLNAGEREQLKTGIHDKCFDAIFAGAEE